MSFLSFYKAFHNKQECSEMNDDGSINFSSVTPCSKSIEDVFRPAFEEIARRREVRDSHPQYGGDEQLFDCPSTTAQSNNVESCAGTQNFMLISMGTQVLAPRPVEETTVFLRVYGAFEHKEDAQEHAEVVRERDASCSLLIVKCNEWCLFPQTELCRDDAEAHTAKLHERRAAHMEQRLANDDLFVRAVTENAERPKTQIDQSMWDEDQEETEAAVREVYSRPKRLRAGAEVRGQNAVVLSVTPDHEHGECLVKLYGCFESSREADEWVQHTGSVIHRDEDLLVATTCEWLYPNGKHRCESNHYRIKELQTIMDAAQKNPKNVRNYKEWKKEQDRERLRIREEEEQQQEQNHIVEVETSSTTTTTTMSEEGLPSNDNNQDDGDEFSDEHMKNRTRAKARARRAAKANTV